MNRRQALRLLMVLGLSPSGVGCAIQSPLRVGSHIWAGYEFLFLAQREGWLNSRNILLQETGSSTETVALLTAGKLDAAALTLDEMLKVRQAGLPLTAVLVFDISMGADVFLAKPGITALSHIRGRRVGFERSAVGELMLHQILQLCGLQFADITPVPATFDQHESYWRDDKVDALISFEPLATRLEGQGARRLFDSSQIPETIFDVLAVTPDAAEHQGDALRQLIGLHFKGVDRFHKNPYDTIYRMSNHLKLSARDALTAFKGLELPGKRRNYQLMSGEPSKLSDAAQRLGLLLAMGNVLNNSKIDPLHLARLTSLDFLPM